MENMDLELIDFNGKPVRAIAIDDGSATWFAVIGSNQIQLCHSWDLVPGRSLNDIAALDAIESASPISNYTELEQAVSVKLRHCQGPKDLLMPRGR